MLLVAESGRMIIADLIATVLRELALGEFEWALVWEVGRFLGLDPGALLSLRDL